MKKVSLFGLGAGLLAALTFTAEPASAQQSTLEIVKNRGQLRCQLGTPAPGWYVLSDSGKWSGFDVENCRAVSAAVFGDPDKIERSEEHTFELQSLMRISFAGFCFITKKHTNHTI